MPLQWAQLKSHPIQNKLWASPSRFTAVVAGRASGKTELSLRRLVRYLPVRQPWPDPRYFFGAPTHDQARRIAWDRLKSLIPPGWISSIGESSGVIKTNLPSGARLHVVGLDVPSRIEGTLWDGCVLDESCELRPKVFDVSVYPTLATRKGWCWRIGVPKRHGIGAVEFRQFFDQCAKGAYEDGEAFTWPSSDIVSAHEIEHAREHLDVVDYREQFEAQFETVGGRIFHAFDPEWNVRPCPYDPTKPLILGCDFNVDPMSWILGHAYEDRFEVIDEVFKRDTNTMETLNFVYGRYATHQGGFAFFGDATGKARKTSAAASDYLQIMNHEGFKKAGRTLHFPDSNPTHADAFASVNAMFCNAAGDRRLFIDPNCERVSRDMQLRAFKPGTREPSDKSGSRTDIGHLSDGLCYVIHRLFPIRMQLGGEVKIGLY